MPDPKGGHMASVWGELKRRNVFKVGVDEIGPQNKVSVRVQSNQVQALVPVIRNSLIPIRLIVMTACVNIAGVVYQITFALEQILT